MDLNQLDKIPSFGFSVATMPMNPIDKGIWYSQSTEISSDEDDSNHRKKPLEKRTVTKAKQSPSKHNEPKAKRPRRAIPAHKTYILETEPTEVDVISGRGGRANNHPGNRSCWLTMLELRPSYRSCDPKDLKKKNEIARKVVDSVRDVGGRYVQLEKETGKWFILPDKVAMEKAKQSLRDSHVPEWINAGAFSSKKLAAKKAPKMPPTKEVTATEDQVDSEAATKIHEELIANIPSSGLPPLTTSFGGGGRNSFTLSVGPSLDGLLGELSPTSLIAIGGDFSLLGYSSNDSLPPTDNKSNTTGGIRTSKGSPWDDMFRNQINPMSASTEIVGV